MVITLILFGVLLVFLLLAAGVMKTREMEQENRLMQSYMASMEEFYSGIQSRIEATRRYRHDLAKAYPDFGDLTGTIQGCSRDGRIYAGSEKKI